MSTPSREYIELRSDEVQEILGTPPSWLVRWGTFIVFLGVAMLIVVAAVVQYADVVPARITLMRTSPPVDVAAPREGYLAAFLARDSQMVQKDQVLAVLQSTAEYNDVRQVDALMNEWQRCIPDSIERIRLPNDLQLGEMQTEYAALAQAVESYNLGKRNKGVLAPPNTRATDQKIAHIEQNIAAEQRSLRSLQSRLAIARERYRQMSTLYEAGALSRPEWERERRALDELERRYRAAEESLLKKQSELAALRRHRQEPLSPDAGAGLSAAGAVQQALSNLQAALNRWKSTYLITAPVGGRVALNGNIFLSRQYVRSGQQLLVIIPSQDDGVVAHLKLPVFNSGKVRPGQQVIIKLDGYPHAEFGVLVGVIHSKSVVPIDDHYTVAVSLPGGLLTTYGKSIPLEHQLNGTAEIVTEQRSILRRIYEQAFVVFR